MTPSKGSLSLLSINKSLAPRMQANFIDEIRYSSFIASINSNKFGISPIIYYLPFSLLSTQKKKCEPPKIYLLIFIVAAFYSVGFGNLIILNISIKEYPSFNRHISRNISPI